jgi:hypothetical protein
MAIESIVTANSLFNPKRGIQSRRVQVDLFNMIYGRKARAGGQFVFEFFDVLRRTLGHNLDATVIEVLHITDDLMPRRGPLSEETKTNALHPAADEKLTRNWRHIR